MGVYYYNTTIFAYNILEKNIKKLGVESRLIRHIELDIINAKDISKDIKIS